MMKRFLFISVKRFYFTKQKTDAVFFFKPYLCPSGYTMAGVPLLGWRRLGRPPHQRAFRRPDSGGGWLCSGSSAPWGVGEEEKLQWCPVCGGDDRAGGWLQVRAHLAQVTKLIPWWNFDSALCVSSAVLHIQTYLSGPGETTGGLWKVTAATWMSVLISVMNVMVVTTEFCLPFFLIFVQDSKYYF